MKKKIAIIGAEGQMGKWFSKYFLEKDFDIIGYDSEKENYERCGQEKRALSRNL